MDNIVNLGFDSWFKDKVDLSKTPDLKIIRVIGVNKNIQELGRVASPKSTEKWCGGTCFRKKCRV
jgi:hypothetical protein